MKPIYICSRYAGLPIERRANLAEARALARYAQSLGYAAVTWWGSLDQEHPTEETPEVRAAAIERSCVLATMVGGVGGDIMIPAWYERTEGMIRDLYSWMARSDDDADMREPYASDVIDLVDPRYRAALTARWLGDEWEHLMPEEVES